MTMDRYTFPLEPQKLRLRFAWRDAWVAAAVHALAIISFAWILHGMQKYDSKAIGTWSVWCLIDFPSGVGALLFEYFVMQNFHPHDFDSTNISMAGLFACLGSFQWFLVCGSFNRRMRQRIGEAVPPAEHVTPAPLHSPYSAPNAQPSEQATIESA